MSASSDIKTNVISDQDRDLAIGALAEFNKKNYSACIQSLNKLENAIGPHLKISHNKAVAEFCKSELKKYEHFKKSLNQILGQGVKSNLIEINDIELCVPYFNKALLLFHTKQPIGALKIMFAIIKHIEHLDDNFVQKAGLLTITLLLDTNQIKRAYALLEVIENRLEINKDILISDEEDEISLATNNEHSSNHKNNKSVEDFKKMYKLVLLRTYILNGKAILISNDETAEISILKGHQYFLGNDYQMAAKELSKRFSNDPYIIKKHREDQNTYLANNMGLIHFTVRHYAMAVKFFQHALTFDQNAIEQVNKDNASVPFYCNAGTKLPEILYNLGIAMLYLQRPKEAFECLLVPLNYNHNNPRLWLRLAEACIMVYKENLKQKENKNIVSSVIGTGLHRKYILKPSPHKYVSDEGQSYAIPSPNLEFASLCLRNAITLIEYFAKTLQQKKSRSDAHFQKQKNKFKTLNELDEEDNNSLEDEETNDDDIDDDVDKTDWSNIDEGIQCNPSKPLTNLAFEKLHYAVLGAYCYVLISLGEYTLALKYGRELLKLKNIPDTYKMLANLYCAESLIMMNRAKDALLYLEPKLIKELNSDDFEKTGTPDWNINTLEAAQSIMTYNLAVTLLIKGDDISLAKSALSTCKHPIVFTHLKLLKIYIELLEGNVDNCRMMIRIDTPQHF